MKTCAATASLLSAASSAADMASYMGPVSAFFLSARNNLMICTPSWTLMSTSWVISFPRNSVSSPSSGRWSRQRLCRNQRGVGASDDRLLQARRRSCEILRKEACHRNRLRLTIAPAITGRSKRTLGEIDAAGGEPEEAQIGCGAGKGRIGTLAQRAAHPLCGLGEPGHGLAEPRAHAPELGPVGTAHLVGRLRQLDDIALHHLAAFQGELARHEVDGLDAVGALVDRQDARVAIDL